MSDVKTLTVSDLLSAKFDAKDVLARDGGRSGDQLLYIPINKVIDRINTVPTYYGHTDLSQVQIMIKDRKVDGPFDVPMWDAQTKTSVNRRQYTVTVTVAMTICGSTRDGVGSDDVILYNKYGSASMDMDKANKTALANAIKKAGNLFGIGTYLWDEQEREKIIREQNGETPEQVQIDMEPHKARIMETAKSLGLGKNDLKDIITVFMKEKYNETVDGNPSCLIRSTAEDTSKLVDELIQHIKGMKK